uniref:Uncharacterized protein n=1 Tax=Anguilla anguilla TaxID=7936 RepID=A0A0E9TGQ9_ANGAN
MHHPYALGTDGQFHLRAVLAHFAFAPDLADRHVGAALSFGLDGRGIPEI